MTIKDIAKICNVGISTVNFARRRIRVSQAMSILFSVLPAIAARRIC